MPYRLLLLMIPAALMAEDPDLTRFVNPWIGTDDGAPDNGLANAVGNTPPGAAYPFGMVLWSPDTTNRSGGYRYDHTTIHGFSLTHFSGRGISCYQDVPFLPVIGPVTRSPGADWAGYASEFGHDNEAATPGYYRALLLNSRIQVELTVTPRTGFARFTFPASADSTLLVNAGGSANGNNDEGTEIAIAGTDRITGSVSSGNCGGSFTYKLYFAAQFDRPFAAAGAWNGDALSPGATFSRGAKSGAYLTFDTSEQPVVQAKVGLSFVSVANAQQNLWEENPGWDFEEVRGRARAAWNARLNRIQVEGGTNDEKTVFYTALYHVFMHPSVFSDTNGEYLGFDQRVHQEEGFTQYHNYAGWDNYRSQMPLLAVIAPEAGDMMQSLVNDARQDPGGGLPRWQHANTNSGGMLGDSQDVVIATVHAFGVRNFDAYGALAAMQRGASQIGTQSAGHTVRRGLGDYMSLGYVSTALSGSAALTLEYVNDDFALSRFAQALGETGQYALYLKRAQSWRNLFHNGYIAPRNADGSFPGNFGPAGENGFVEGSAAQYVWMIPFNMRGLIDLMGGNERAIERLNYHFTELNAGPASEYAFMGNEPELKTPWAYNFAGAPWRSQQLVRRILLQLFRNAPGGVPGNDDGGTMGSWAVWGSIGLFPPIPGVGGLVVGSPLFPAVTVHFPDGATLQIRAPAASAGTPYVQSLSLNGAAHDSPWIPWEAIAEGATLEFVLGDAPKPDWGSDPAAAPPSFELPDIPADGCGTGLAARPCR